MKTAKVPNLVHYKRNIYIYNYNDYRYHLCFLLMLIIENSKSLYFTIWLTGRLTCLSIADTMLTNLKCLEYLKSILQVMWVFFDEIYSLWYTTPIVSYLHSVGNEVTQVVTQAFVKFLLHRQNYRPLPLLHHHLVSWNLTLFHSINWS